MTNFNSNNKSTIKFFIERFITTIDSRVNIERVNEFTPLYLRVSKTYHYILNNIDNLSIESLIYYKEALYHINIIHNNKNPLEDRRREAELLINKLNRIEQELGINHHKQSTPRFVEIDQKKKPVKEPEEIDTNIIIAAHSSDYPIPEPFENIVLIDTEKELRELSKRIYSKIDALNGRFTYAPIEIIFKERDINKTPYYKSAPDKVKQKEREKLMKNYLSKISSLYSETNEIFENLLDYLQKYYSKNVTKKDLDISNMLISRIIIVVKYLDKAIHRPTTKEEMIECYTESLKAVVDIKEYFNDIFIKDKKLVSIS